MQKESSSFRARTPALGHTSTWREHSACVPHPRRNERLLSALGIR